MFFLRKKIIRKIHQNIKKNRALYDLVVNKEYDCITYRYDKKKTVLIYECRCFTDLKGCHKIDLKVEVKNPVEFVMEVFGYDESNNENSKGQIRRLGTMLLKNIL